MNSQLSEISLDELDHTTGGVSIGGAAKAVGKFALKKAVPVAAVAGAAYGGYQSYQKGNGWGTIAKDALMGAIF